MAAVDTLRVLLLLYLVNAEVDVPALEAVLVELRQLLEAIELELDASGRPLLVLLGDTARSELPSPVIYEGKGERPPVLELFVERGGERSRPRRPLRHDEASSALEWFDAEEGGGALRPIIKLLTLLAVVVMVELLSKWVWDVGSGTSSTGETDAACAFPKLSFHLDGFLTGAAGGTAERDAVTVEGIGGTGGAGVDALLDTVLEVLEDDPVRDPARSEQSGVGRAYMDTGSNGRDLRESLVDALEALVDDDLKDGVFCIAEPDAFDVLLSSRAKDWDATARVVNVSSLS